MKRIVDITEIEDVLITARSLASVLDVWIYVAEEKEEDLINASCYLLDNVINKLKEVLETAEEPHTGE